VIVLLAEWLKKAFKALLETMAADETLANLTLTDFVNHNETTGFVAYAFSVLVKHNCNTLKKRFYGFEYRFSNGV